MRQAFAHYRWVLHCRLQRVRYCAPYLGHQVRGLPVPEQHFPPDELEREHPSDDLRHARPGLAALGSAVVAGSLATHLHQQQPEHFPQPCRNRIRLAQYCVPFQEPKPAERQALLLPLHLQSVQRSHRPTHQPYSYVAGRSGTRCSCPFRHHPSLQRQHLHHQLGRCCARCQALRLAVRQGPVLLARLLVEQALASELARAQRRQQACSLGMRNPPDDRGYWRSNLG